MPFVLVTAPTTYGINTTTVALDLTSVLMGGRIPLGQRGVITQFGASQILSPGQTIVFKVNGVPHPHIWPALFTLWGAAATTQGAPIPGPGLELNQGDDLQLVVVLGALALVNIQLMLAGFVEDMPC